MLDRIIRRDCCKKKKDRENAIIEEQRLAEIREKKRKHDEEMKSWDSKVQELNESIDVLKNTLEKLEKQQKQAFEDAERFKNKNMKEAAIKTAKLAAQNISELRTELDSKKDKMSRLMLKKPKYS